MKTELFFLIVLMAVQFAGCKKTPGEGGKASITGYITKETRYIGDNSVVEKTFAAKESVYIIYGENVVYGDKTETNAKGAFEFDYLLPGDYTLIVYSDDTTSNYESNAMPLEKKVTIGKKDKEVNAGDFETIDFIDFDDGTSSIKGRIYVVNYNSTFTAINNEYFGPDVDVYLIYGNEPSFVERVKTNYDGTFSFEKLIKGSYSVYAYSDDSTGSIASGVYPVLKETEITENFQNIDLGVFRLLD